MDSLGLEASVLDDDEDDSINLNDATPEKVFESFLKGTKLV